jgi:hypothetical protein
MLVLAAATVFFVVIIASLAGVLIRIGRAAGDHIPRAARASGVIVDLIEHAMPGAWDSTDGGPSVPVRHPQVRFTTAEGRESTFISTFGTSTGFKRVGQPVDVLYDPADPSRAQVAPESVPTSFGCARAAMWAVLAVVTLLGIIGFTIAWLVATQLHRAAR